MSNAYQITQQTRDTLSRSIETVRNRKVMYAQALVAFAFEKTKDGTLKICYGLITYLSPKMSKPTPIYYEYENLVIARQLMSVEDSISFLEKMYLQGAIELEELDLIPFHGTLYSYEYLESRYSHSYAKTDWPSIVVSGRLENDTQGSLTQNPLVSKLHPLFPNGIEALRATLDLRFSEDAYTINPTVEVVIPDYRAKIAGLVIDGTRITLEVLFGSGKADDMIIKYFSRGINKTEYSENLSLASNTMTLELAEEPLIVEVHLLSSEDGSTIDRIGYNYRYSRTKEGITLKDEQVFLLDLISRGENQTVEFKQELDKNKHLEVIETVVSFANTMGGMVLLGVSDNGEVIGIHETNIKERLNSWITELCDPPIEVEYRVANVQEKSIGILEVSEGQNKPYVLKDKGPYVRRGSTDRSAKRSEIDEFYQNRKSRIAF